MGKKRIIFYCIFAAYQLLTVAFTVIIDKKASILFGLLRYLWVFKYVALLGLALVIVDVIWSARQSRVSGPEENRNESDNLSARIIDFDAAKKKAAGGSK